MKSVKVYYAGIPAKNKNLEKEKVLHNFHLGVPNNQSEEIREPRWEASDLAVMQGWVHANSGTTPHLMFRRKIIQEQKRIGKHTLAIDSNLFLYKDPGNTKSYLRFSLDDVFPTTGNYFTDDIDPKRWLSLKRNLGIDLVPYTNKGKHILVCLQRDGGWSMGGLSSLTWLDTTIEKIRRHSDRQIIVRGHPGDAKTLRQVKIKHTNVVMSNQQSIIQDFRKCWATVTYNSSPGVASAIEGIPVFVTDPDPRRSQAYSVCNVDLANIETPKRPERQQWIEKLAMSHFNFMELRNGTAWDIIKEYI